MENHDSKKGGVPGCAVIMLMLPFGILFSMGIVLLGVIILTGCLAAGIFKAIA